MKKVLLVSTSFPPHAGGGVLRPSRLAKYLPAWGWHAVVLTTSVGRTAGRFGDPGEKYAETILRPPRLDITELYATIRRGMRAFRDMLWTGRKPDPSYNVSARTVSPRPRLSNYLLVPDPRVLWIPGAVLVGLWVLRRRKIDAIYSTAPDYSAHLVGWVLARLTRIRWIAEFRDPWIANPFRHKRPVKWMDKCENWLERRVVLDCDHLCVTSDEYRSDFLRRYDELDASRVTFVPNGFDPEDFERIEPAKFERFSILHAGNFYGARSAALFLDACFRLVARRADLKEKMQVIFVGSLDAASIEMIQKSNLGANVLYVGQKSHDETLRMMCGADILLLIPGPGSGTMPGKIFEYLRAGRPIYSLASEGPAGVLVREAHVGYAEASLDPQVVACSLEEFVDSVRTGRNAWVCPAETLARYDRRLIAGRIASILLP